MINFFFNITVATDLTAPEVRMDDDSQGLWISKYVESKRTKKPVYFEAPVYFRNKVKGKLNNFFFL